jgi:hypothetical protein
VIVGPYLAVSNRLKEGDKIRASDANKGKAKEEDKR